MNRIDHLRWRLRSCQNESVAESDIVYIVYIWPGQWKRWKRNREEKLLPNSELRRVEATRIHNPVSRIQNAEFDSITIATRIEDRGWSIEDRGSGIGIWEWGMGNGGTGTHGGNGSSTILMGMGCDAMRRYRLNWAGLSIDRRWRCRQEQCCQFSQAFNRVILSTHGCNKKKIFVHYLTRTNERNFY